MKKYNKILEAIQKGINIALDDFEDEEIQSQKVSNIIDQNLSYDTLFNIENFVDLGLPSGNLWAKYNFGVNPKSLSNYKNWYGKYYAWGELNTKNDYRQNNYKFSKWDYNQYKYTKYCNDLNEGFHEYTDNYINLLPEDDVIHQNLGKNYYMPSEKDILELINYTNQEYVYDYNGVKKLNGVIFSNIQDNTKTIFIPCAGTRCAKGHFNKDGYCGDGFEIHIWASTYAYDFIPDRAYTLDVYQYLTTDYYRRNKFIQNEDTKFCKLGKDQDRFQGCSVRAIYRAK